MYARPAITGVLAAPAEISEALNGHYARTIVGDVYFSKRFALAINERAAHALMFVP